MIQWPWVSRALMDKLLEERERALGLVIAERDRLREQNVKLVEHTLRMDRVEHKLSEAPREARRALEPMTKFVIDYVRGFASRELQRDLTQKYLRRHAAGESWAKIEADLRQGDASGATAPTA